LRLSKGRNGGRHTSRSESQDFLTPFRRFLEAPVLLDNGRLMAQRTGEFWTCYYQNAIIARCETRPAASRFLEQFPEQMERWEEEQRVRISRARAYLWRKK
jgi:hypothetical protein